MLQTSLGCNGLTCSSKLTTAQRRQQVARKDDTLSKALGEPLVDQEIRALLKRSTHVSPKSQLPYGSTETWLDGDFEELTEDTHSSQQWPRTVLIEVTVTHGIDQKKLAVSRNSTCRRWKST